MQPIVIVGAGLAGYTVAREFRKLDKVTPLIVITADSGGFYSKPMLSNAFAQGKGAQQLLTQNAAQMSAQLNAHVMTGTRVNGIDSVRKTIDTSSGTFEYAQLVLAVGAQPIRLALAGDAADQVLSVNHIDDYAQFRARIELGDQPTRRITILGAGLIGCEFADDLAGAGHSVTLVDPNPLPLAALAPKALSEGLRTALIARGIGLRLGTTASSIDAGSDGIKVTLADGTSIDTDIVLSAVGYRPDLRLANAAQLATARGILIDAAGQTSAADIYALGDCAEYSLPHGPCLLPYIAPIMAAGRAIARTLTCERTEIDLKAAPVIVKTPSYPLALVPPPLHAIANGRWHDETGDARIVCRFYDSDGLLAGFGVSPQESGIRQQLLAALGAPAPA